jgi:hypothetical protein
MLLRFTDQEEETELGSEMPHPPNGQPHEVVDSTPHSASSGAPSASCKYKYSLYINIFYYIHCEHITLSKCC